MLLPVGDEMEAFFNSDTFTYAGAYGTLSEAQADAASVLEEIESWEVRERVT